MILKFEFIVNIKIIQDVQKFKKVFKLIIIECFVVLKMKVKIMECQYI